MLVDNQLTLFTTAKISSNWHYPIRLTQMVYALWLQNFLQGLLMCDRFWFLHIFSYSNPIKSQLKTVLIDYCLHERIWVNFGCGNDDIGNSAISCRWQWIIILRWILFFVVSARRNRGAGRCCVRYFILSKKKTRRARLQMKYFVIRRDVSLIFKF